MAKKEYYMVRVDENGIWTPCKYRKVTREELDKLVEDYGKKVLALCSNGNIGAMSMWACFKSRICSGCYSEMINMYRLLSNDNKSLVDREHELRHMWYQYEELWQIRVAGSVADYYLKKAEESKEHFENYYKEDEK